MFVSVVMAAYNRRDYIGAAIESVLAQRHPDFELIVVNDCSTDGTAEIVAKFSQRDRRVKVVHNTTNKGLAVSLNTGLAVARAELIARHDDDDLMLPDRLARQIEFMQAHPDISVASSWARLIDESGNFIGKSCPTVDLERGIESLDPKLFLEIIHPATMYRRRHVLDVGGYRNVMLEDRDLWGRMVVAGYKIAVQPEFLVHHRRHGNSLMTTQLDEIFEYGDYIDFNVVRRMRGLDEISLHRYRELQSSRPLLERLWEQRKRRSQIAFRQATLCYGKRRWLPLAGRISAAIALSPIATMRRMAEKVGPPGERRLQP